MVAKLIRADEIENATKNSQWDKAAGANEIRNVVDQMLSTSSFPQLCHSLDWRVLRTIIGKANKS